MPNRLWFIEPTKNELPPPSYSTCIEQDELSNQLPSYDVVTLNVNDLTAKYSRSNNQSSS